MENEKSLFVQFCGEAPLIKIIDFLLENRDQDYTKADISKGSLVSKSALFKHWSVLEDYGIVRVTRKFGKTKLYTLNSKSIVSKEIVKFESTLISEALKQDAMKQKALCGDDNSVVQPITA